MKALDWLVSYRRGNRLLHGFLFALTTSWLMAFWLLYLYWVMVGIFYPDPKFMHTPWLERLLPLLAIFPFVVLSRYSELFWRGRSIAGSLRWLWAGLLSGTVLAVVVAWLTQPAIFFIVMLPALPGVHLIHVALNSKDAA